MAEPTTSNFPSSIDNSTSLGGDVVNLTQLTLDAGITAASPTISVAETITNINTPCYLLIGNELIWAEGKSGGDFINCVRGAGGTSAASASSGAIVYLTYGANLFNQLKRAIIAAQTYMLETPTEVTVSSNVLTVTKSRHKIQPQSGNLDDIETITGMPDGSTLYLYASDAGTDTLTFKHGLGNLSCFGGDDIDLSHGYVICFRSGSTVYVAGGGGGFTGAELKNNSASSVSPGDVVIFDNSSDTSFTTTTTAVDVRVAGVAYKTIAAGATGQVSTIPGSLVTVNCDSAAVARGQFLTSSTTAGKATAGSYYRENGVFAVALTSKAGGSTGTVQAMLVDNYRQVIVGTSGWNSGGISGTTAQTASEKFTITSETWANVAGAALPAARNLPNGIAGSTTAMYITHGSSTNSYSNVTSTRYKNTYSTETISTLTASAISLFAYRSGANFSTKGYTAGGGNSANNSVSSVYRTTYSTDAEAVTNSLTTARSYAGALSDGTYYYVGGGNATSTDRVDAATETPVLTASAAVANASTGYCYVSFPASAGYRVFNNGSGTSYSRKLTYSTATDSSNASSATGNIDSGAQVTDGVSVAYVGAVTTTNKLSSSTGTYTTISSYATYRQGASASYGAL